MTAEEMIARFAHDLVEKKAARRKGKKKADGGELPGPLIGWLIKNGKIQRKKGYRRGVVVTRANAAYKNDPMSRKKAQATRYVDGKKLGKWKKG